MRVIVWAIVFLIGANPYHSFSQSKSYSPIHIGFCYPLSTNGMAAPEFRNGASFHALVGVSSNEDAFCASGLASIVRDSSKGIQASGLLGYAGGSLSSAQFSGFTGIVRGRLTGIQASGFNSYAGSLSGCQLSGFLNVVKDSAIGLQAAGFANVASVAGPQLAGFCNISERTKSLQAAGFVNVSRSLSGVQTAGFINVADSVSGAQLAGFINIARKVKGVQIAGFINVADSSEYPIGLINIIGNGERWLGAQYDETGTALVSFRSGSAKLYGILAVGINPLEKDLRYALEGGIGMHAFRKGHFRLKTELTVTSITRFDEGVFMRSALRVLPSVHIGRVFELYGGVSAGFVNTPQRDAFHPDLPYLWERNSRGTFYGISAGAVAGIQLSL